MNISEFREEFDNLTLERRRAFANRVMNELTKQINQEYKDGGTSFFFEEDLLPILEMLEADDYFGTEGFKG